ncbi:uncharacterized protein C8orf48 homolog [Ambystoma mexicanum]|uniref:uncharacterized protein C8orf48 homolog n=1 Tax=Ambystoma mexicanum TaxID=8296 RepID=UPI0037E9A53E
MVDLADYSDSSAVESMKPDSSTESTVSSYSEDPFEPITNDSGSSREYESEPFESYHSEEESEGRTGSEAAIHAQPDGAVQSTKVEQNVETTFLEKERINKWITTLQDKTEKRQPKEVVKPLTGPSEDTSDEVADALESFCYRKIRQICLLSKSKQQDGGKKKKLHPRIKSRKAEGSDQDTNVPTTLVNRVYLKNISETLKQANELKIHDPSSCPDCSAKKAELAKIDFIRRRKTKMEGIRIQEKMEEQIYLKDSITLIGEIHRTLPKLSEDPRLIWQKLFETGQTP